LNPRGIPASTLGALVEEVRDACDPGDAGLTPYIGLEHIGKGSLRLEGRGAARDVTSRKKRFRRGDVLFGSLRPEFRKVVVAPFDGLCSTDITVLRARCEADASFVFYVVASRPFIDLATQVATGARMPRVAWSSLQGFALPELSPVERARRGALLYRYDQLIEDDLARIRAVDALVRALHLRSLLPLGPLGPARRRVPREPPRIVPLGSLVDRVGESVRPGEIPADTPYFGLEHLPRRCIAVSSWGRAGDARSRVLRVAQRDILFGRLRPSLHKVGPCPLDGVCSSDVLVLRAREPVHFGWLVAALSSDEMVRHAAQASQGTRMPRVSWEVLRERPMVVPPPALLRRLHETATRGIEWIFALLARTRNLSTTRDLLVPLLLSGEPAEVPPLLGSRSWSRPPHL
jgi:type I restriction enzyme S subunit